MEIRTGDIVIGQVMSSNNPLLISGPACNILIDTGRKSSFNSIESKLRKKLGTRPLDAVIITHAHYDHAENATALKKSFGAKIIIHEDESSYLQNGESSPLPAWKYSIGERINQIEEFKKYFEPATTDTKVKKYYDLGGYGINAYILNTPGHTNGSVSVIINHEIAITGDTDLEVFKKPFEKKIKILPDDALGSWEKLIALKCKYYITAHNGIKLHEDIVYNLEKYRALLADCKR